MRTLVIDTATRACSVALYDDDTHIASHFETIGRGHAECLLSFISRLPDRGKADRVVANVGPGSFTGIRVGVAAARALGFAWAIPVSGYHCLQLVAAISRAQTNSMEPVDVAMIGGHGEYFFEQFDSANISLGRAASLTPGQAALRSSAATVAGDASVDLVAKRGTGIALDLLPDAASWHLIAKTSALPAAPIYGRTPDAKLGGINTA